MAEFTTNFKLSKPSQSDYYNIDGFNENSDIIDGQMKKNADAISANMQKIDDLRGQLGNYLPSGGITWGTVAGK